jgi:hypothetical protein
MCIHLASSQFDILPALTFRSLVHQVRMVVTSLVATSLVITTHFAILSMTPVKLYLPAMAVDTSLTTGLATTLQRVTSQLIPVHRFPLFPQLQPTIVEVHQVGIPGLIRLSIYSLTRGDCY